MAAADVVFILLFLWIIGVAIAAFQFNFLSCAITLTLVGIYVLARRRISPTIFLLSSLALLSGAWYTHAFANIQKERLVLPKKGEAYVALVTAAPHHAKSGELLTLALEVPLHGTVTALISSGGDITYGDRVRVTGSIKTDQGDPFVAFPGIEVLARNQGFWLKAYLLKVKFAVRAELTRLLPAEPGALMNGLLLGDTSGFSDDFKQAMADSGTTHITALSGYNIAILIQAVSFALVRVLRRRTRFFITIALILLFVLMVGGEASIVRAAIMGLLLLIAQESGRPYAVKNSIAFAAFLMLLFDPFLIAQNIGFQLSFMSLLGIVYITPMLMNIFRLDPKKMADDIFDWRGNAVTTLGAQLAVLPILIAAFGSFSLTSVITNIFALEIVPFTMLLGFIIVVCGFIFAPLGTLIALIARVPLVYLSTVIRLGARFAIPLSLSASSTFMVIYYTLLIALVWAIMYPTRNAHH